MHMMIYLIRLVIFELWPFHLAKINYLLIIRFLV